MIKINKLRLRNVDIMYDKMVDFGKSDKMREK